MCPTEWVRIGCLLLTTALVTNVRTLFRDLDNVFVHACEYMGVALLPGTTSKIHRGSDHKVAAGLHKIG